MDKNVSGVDLDELLKAREELNKEIGVETDPNMYSDYNPNRKTEEFEETSTEKSEDVTSEKADAGFSGAELSEENNHIVLENSKSDEPKEESKFEDGYTEESKKVEEKETHSSASENLQKYDIFSAFEVKENVHESAGEKLDFNKLEDSSQRTTNLEKLENELAASSNYEEETDSTLDASEKSKFEEIENIDELGILLDKLLDDLDAEDEEMENSSEENNEESAENEVSQKIKETVGDSENQSIQSDEASEADTRLSESYVTSIDIDPSFDDEEEIPEKEDRLGLFMKGNLGSTETSKEENSEEDDGSNLVEINIDGQNYISDSVEDKDESLEEKSSFETADLLETLENSEENSEENEESENVQEESVSYLEEIKSETIQEKKESVALESYDASKASPSTVPKTRFENSLSDEQTEVITDYSQLREILQRELKESEEASQEKIEEEDEGEKYAIIEEFKFLDEIATDEFKNSDKFSYIMGKNEKGEMVYGNFREHYNLAVFGKNDIVMNSFLNSMVLSLCLKNSTSDVNFVMLDSNINSTFEVYNKSSYLYFNRIAKTNKEILDTLIEVTKELDIRYERLAEAGMGNAEQFNDMARETETTPMTHLIVVFNNYTDASQATYVDKINACLYQILKFGRLVGIYAVVTAMLPITTSQVNYNLSSRLSFKSDQDSKYTVGVEGTHRLPDESDAIYFNISKNTTEHIKTATVTDTELDLIIKELEE